MTIEAAPVVPSASEDRTVAILSYLTLIGFIVAVVLHATGKKTAIGAYHLRQTLGLLLTGVAACVVVALVGWIPILGWLAALAIWIGFLALWILGLVAAIQGRQKPVPVLGDSYQKWFAGAFN